MSSSAAHKRIVFAGMGCAVALIGLLVFGIVLALRERPELLSEIASMSEFSSPAMAAAAVDSLNHVDWAPIRRPRADQLSFPAAGTGNGAAIAIRVWSGKRLRFATVPFGDTAEVGTQRWNVWRTYTEPEWVDSLIAAAHQPWHLSGSAIALPDTGAGIFRTTLTAYPVLNTTRGVLARASSRWPDDSAAGVEAARAAVTIGRALQADPVLMHVAIGLRAEREALTFLARRNWPGAKASLTQVDEALDAVMRGLRLIRIAGGSPENSAVLARVARDESLLLAVRREALIAIGYGWALNSMESGTVPAMVPRNNERNRTLDGIEPASLPDALHATLADARATAEFGFSRRVLVGPDYQALTASLRSNW